MIKALITSVAASAILATPALAQDSTATDTTYILIPLVGEIPTPTDWETLSQDWGVGLTDSTCQRVVDIQANTFAVWQSQITGFYQGLLTTEQLKTELCAQAFEECESTKKDLLFENQALKETIEDLSVKLKAAEDALR